MIIAAQNYSDHAFFVYSSVEEWDNLIISNVKNCKETYVFDPHAHKEQYPKSVKLIKSVPTAKRFIGVRLTNSFIFINSIYVDVSKKFIKSMIPFRSSYYLIRIDLKDFTKLIKDREVDLCCRRNMWRIKQYK